MLRLLTALNRKELANSHLLLTSHEVASPKGGMWYITLVINNYRQYDFKSFPRVR